MSLPTDDTDRRRTEPAYPGTPAWVKAFAIAILLGALVLVAATLFGMHTPMGHGG
ncbi:MAG TPA: hypothetical protein VGK15_03380 [Candidatus Limnocylindria bacterium]|jgi:hypothetical protein